MTNRVYVMTFLFLLGLAAFAQAQAFTTIYNFTGGSDGGYPYAGVIQDSAGSLYSNTSGGGRNECEFFGGCGVLFKLDTSGTETVLYSFYGGEDGENPARPLVRDIKGNLYGTTPSGGAYNLGIVFKIDTAGNERVLHSFAGGSDGCTPQQGLVMDEAGNLYGTTSPSSPCVSGFGTIFQIGRGGNYTVLHTFAGPPSDGGNPINGHLVMNDAGDLYGVTTIGGAYGYGTVYELNKDAKLTILHSFAGGTTDGCLPYGSVLQDETGNLYGTTYTCGSTYSGTVWKVSEKGKETILHNFAGTTADGCGPGSGVSRDSKGNLYGVSGCGANGDGALYKLSPRGKLGLLHSFDGSDGSGPNGVLLTSKGYLFGTTQGGGTDGAGTVWKYVP